MMTTKDYSLKKSELELEGGQNSAVVINYCCTARYSIAKCFTLNNLTTQLKNNNSNNKYPI